jgi:hypothetical protein
MNNEYRAAANNFLDFLIRQFDFCDDCTVKFIVKGDLPENLCLSCSREVVRYFALWRNNLPE